MWVRTQWLRQVTVLVGVHLCECGGNSMCWVMSGRGRLAKCISSAKHVFLLVHTQQTCLVFVRVCTFFMHVCCSASATLAQRAQCALALLNRWAIGCATGGIGRLNQNRMRTAAAVRNSPWNL